MCYPLAIMLKPLSFQLVGRLSQEELMGQLPSFLPALFDAFGNQSADVRKVIIFSFSGCQQDYLLARCD